jgi:hypothetical protein
MCINSLLLSHRDAVRATSDASTQKMTDVTLTIDSVVV